MYTRNSYPWQQRTEYPALHILELQFRNAKSKDKAALGEKKQLRNRSTAPTCPLALARQGLHAIKQERANWGLPWLPTSHCQSGRGHAWATKKQRAGIEKQRTQPTLTSKSAARGGGRGGGALPGVWQGADLGLQALTHTLARGGGRAKFSRFTSGQQEGAALRDLLPPPPWGLGVLAQLSTSNPLDGRITSQRSTLRRPRGVMGQGAEEETSVPPRAAPWLGTFLPAPRRGSSAAPEGPGRAGSDRHRPPPPTLPPPGNSNRGRAPAGSPASQLRRPGRG